MTTDGALGRPTWVEVDLDAIAHNVRRVRQMLGPETRLMAVVKADGYGHGALPVARTALAAGASWLGVATADEALRLREAGLLAPVLVFGHVSPGVAPRLAAERVAIAAFSLHAARAVSEALQPAQTLAVHLKIDTGMGRIGLRPDAVDEAISIARLPGLQVEGAFTHFAVADEPDPDAVAFTRRQLERFLDCLSRLRAAGLEVALRHAANSAGVWRFPEAHLDLVRVGISLYGYAPWGAARFDAPTHIPGAHAPGVPAGAPATAMPALDLRPALRWKTRIAQVRQARGGEPVSYGRTYRARAGERIATLPVGYADGLDRRLSNLGEVLVAGRRAPIVGRICMDQTMISLPAGVDAAPGVEVALLEAPEITADELAERLGTINYEILTSIGPRVPRLYRASSSEPLAPRRS